MSSTVASIDYALKERYSAKTVANATLKKNWALDMCPKDTGFAGDVEPVPIIYGNPQGAGITVAGAQANKTNVVGKKWNISVGEYFAAIDIGDKALKAARNDLGSFLKHNATEIDGLLTQIGNDLSLQFWGNAGGAFGRRASASTNVITLTNKYDASNFEPGMIVAASAADGTSGALRTGTTAVASVDYAAGTVTLVSAAAITSFADNDYLFRSGATDIGGSSLWKGLQSWVPSSAPTGGDNFFGMDRSTSDRLSGYRLPATSGTLEEIFGKMATEINTIFGTTPGKGACHPRQWYRLQKQLAAQGTRPIEVKNRTGTFGYSAIEMVTSYGPVAICADRHCPLLQGWLLDFDHIKLKSMTELVHAMNEDGLQMLRAGATADYELRWASYAQLVIDKPSAQARAILPAVS